MRIKHTTIIHYAILLSMIAYVFVDLQNSALVGNSNANRTGVYLMIGVLLALSATRDFFKQQRYYTRTEFALLLIVVWIILCNIFMLNFQWTTYIHIGLALLWYLLYKFFYNHNGIDPQLLKHTQLFFVLILCIYAVALLSSSFRMRGELNNDDAVLNTAYYVLIFLPVVFSFKKKYTKIIAVSIIAFCVFWTFKRGAIVAFFAMLLCYYYTQKKLGSAQSGILRFLAICAVLLLMLGFVDRYTGGIISDRFSWANLQDGSGRNDLYTRAFSYLRSCDFITLLFGRGAGATARYIGESAHNEWLEFIICYGLVGVFLYLNLMISIFRHYLLLLRQKQPNAACVGILLTYWLCVSMYGAIYFIQSTIFVVSMLGLYSQKGREMV